MAGDDELAKQFEEALMVEDAPQDISEDKPVDDKPTDDVPADDVTADDNKKEETPTDGKPDDEKPIEDDKPDGDTEQAEETPEEKPAFLTKDDLKSVMSELRTEQTTSARELDSMTQDVLDAYYPNGLSNVFIDEQTGKEIKTPQDVVDLSGDTMSIEEASKWLMNEQYKLDKQVSDIKNNAKDIAETTLRFKKDSVDVIQRYTPLFNAYPGVQQEVYDLYIRQVKLDAGKGIVTEAPDMGDFYDSFLRPYKLAFEKSTQTPATEEPPKEEPPKVTTDDRLDVSGDGGDSEVDDPNDFVSQVKKEFSRED